MIPFYVITGFLGSGKTTLLKNVLDHLSDKKRIAIIQNEFASTSTDGEELKQSGKAFKLVEVNNGSVFCVCLMASFPNVLDRIIDTYNPDMILLEASGLSDPINILELVQASDISQKIRLERIVSIIDATNFSKALNLLTRTKHQLLIADTVLLNKTDRIEDPRSIVPQIRDINPYAEIVATSYCNINVERILLAEGSEHPAARNFGQSESEGRPDISTCVLKPGKKISQEGLLKFVKELQEDCLRIKGFVNMADGQVMLIHSVFDNFEYTPVKEYSGPSEIVAFGHGLTPSVLRERFLSFCD